MFQVVAIVVGALAESERRSRDRQERTASELAEAYEKLRERLRAAPPGRSAGRRLGSFRRDSRNEIKNPLASIKASLEILFTELPLDRGKREFAEIVERELGQLQNTVDEFLQFARTPKPVLREPLRPRRRRGLSQDALLTRSAAACSSSSIFRSRKLYPRSRWTLRRYSKRC